MVESDSTNDVFIELNELITVVVGKADESGNVEISVTSVGSINDCTFANAFRARIGRLYQLVFIDTFFIEKSLNIGFAVLTELYV